MAKDNTVIGSLLVVGIGIILFAVGIIPESGNGQPWYIIITMLAVWLAGFRLVMILPIQSLIHSVKNESGDKKVKWILAHVFLWPLAGLAYYSMIKKH